MNAEEEDRVRNRNNRRRRNHNRRAREQNGEGQMGPQQEAEKCQVSVIKVLLLSGPEYPRDILLNKFVISENKSIQTLLNFL